MSSYYPLHILHTIYQAYIIFSIKQYDIISDIFDLTVAQTFMKTNAAKKITIEKKK